MFLKEAFQSGTKSRRRAVLGAATAAFLSLPVMMYSFDPNPPIGFTGAPGQGQGCASCHGTLTTPSALTVTAPSSYTPGGAAVPMTISIPSSGGFELVIETQTGGAQAGTLTAGTGSQVKTLGALQDLSDSASNTSWTFSWMPPATNVGTVVLYATGGTHNASYLTSVTITAPSGGPPPTPTLTVSPTSLSFTAAVGGTAPSQTVAVAMSDNSAATFNAAAAVTTPTGGTWLGVGSATGTTPATETISVNTTGLAAGTYNGTVTFTSSSSSPNSVMLPVTLTVGSTPPPTTGETFSLVVVDQSSGGDWLLLGGRGSVSSSSMVNGSGYFSRFRGSTGVSDDGGATANASIVAEGTWKATSVTTSTSTKIVMEVQLTATAPGSSSLSTGTLTITNAGATLAISGGATFNPVGVGMVSITSGSSGGGGGGGGGGSDDGFGGGDSRIRTDRTLTPEIVR